MSADVKNSLFFPFLCLRFSTGAFPLAFCSLLARFFDSFSYGFYYFGHSIFDFVFLLAWIVDAYALRRTENNYFRLRFRLSIRATIKKEPRKNSPVSKCMPCTAPRSLPLSLALTPSISEEFVCECALAQRGWRFLGPGYHIVHTMHRLLWLCSFVAHHCHTYRHTKKMKGHLLLLCCVRTR